MFCTGLRAGYFALRQQRLKFLLAEAAAVDELEIVDIDAFLLDGGRIGRHRARRDAADIGMVAAARDPEQDVASSSSNTGVHTVMSGKCVPPL